MTPCSIHPLITVTAGVVVEVPSAGAVLAAAGVTAGTFLDGTLRPVSGVR